MRRHTPPRSVRHQSPPRKRGRGRSLSPLARNQPAPPGEERGRKPAPWDSQTNRGKRFRSRSRPREWAARPDVPFDRELPFMHMSDSERPRGREPPRDKMIRNRDIEKPRDRNRERDRSLHLPRENEMRDPKHKRHQRKPSRERNLLQPDEFEESYLDNHPNHYGNNGGILKSHDEIIVDPSSVNFNMFVSESRSEHNSPDKHRDIPRDIHHHSQREHRAPPKDVRNPVSRGRESSRHEKEESSAERINRLEKLVEKLVEVKANPGPSKDFAYQHAKDIIPELIPSDTKFTTSMWLNCIHEECLNRNYDEKSSIRFMADKMAGIMKAWFKSVSSYEFTWPELKLLITKTFPDNVEFAQTLKLLVLRDKTAGETITQYFFSKVYLCEACKITGKNAVSCLIDGLSNPFMKQDIQSCNFLTPEALYTEYLTKFPENEVPIRVDRREVREVIPEYPIDEFIPLEVDSREHNFQAGKMMHYPHGEHFESRPSMEPLERKKCFTCKRIGHATVDCRHAPICYNCKKKGHIAAKCHFINALLVSSASSSYSIPYVKCNINGQELDGIIDTGCVAVILKKQIAKDLKLNVRCSIDILKGYGGFETVPLGKTEIFLSVGSINRHVKAFVVEDEVQQAAVIIGQDFLSQEGVALYQENGQIAIFNSNITICY